MSVPFCHSAFSVCIVVVTVAVAIIAAMFVCYVDMIVLLSAG